MIEIIRHRISEEKIKKFLGNPFADMVKFVVDVKREIVALGGELHADAEAVLLEDGSKQEDLWGGNFYPHQSKKNQVEYTALINLRPSAENRSMDVQDERIKKRIKKILDGLLL